MSDFENKLNNAISEDLIEKRYLRRKRYLHGHGFDAADALVSMRDVVTVFKDWSAPTELVTIPKDVADQIERVKRYTIKINSLQLAQPILETGILVPFDKSKSECFKTTFTMDEIKAHYSSLIEFVEQVAD